MPNGLIYGRRKKELFLREKGTQQKERREKSWGPQEKLPPTEGDQKTGGPREKRSRACKSNWGKPVADRRLKSTHERRLQPHDVDKKEGEIGGHAGRGG